MEIQELKIDGVVYVADRRKKLSYCEGCAFQEKCGLISISEDSIKVNPCDVFGCCVQLKVKED